MDSSKTTFFVSSKVLLQKLKIAQRVVSNNSIIPILDNFLFILEDDSLSIVTSDLQTSLVTDVEIAGLSGSCRIAIPAKRLVDLVSVCKDTALTFEISRTTTRISTGTGEYVIECFPGHEFPACPDIVGDKFTIKSSDLMWGLDKTSFCASVDEDMQVLAGVNFILTGGNVYFAATDKYKMSECAIETSDNLEASFVIPVKSVAAVVGMLGKNGDVSVMYNEKNVSFKLDKTVVVCRRMEGNYPNYKAILAQDFPIVSSVNKNDMLMAVRRVSVFAPKKTGFMTLKFKEDELIVSTKDVDYSISGDETIPCKTNGHCNISFKAEYLIDALSHIEGENLSVKLKNEYTACCLYTEGTNNTILLMPMSTT